MARSMLPAATSFLIWAKNSLELTRYRPSWKAARSTMIVITTADTTMFRAKNQGLVLKASNMPPSLPPPSAANISR